jgi:flagellar basal body-associated protein FliL
MTTCFEYVILIIIAALVLISALLGLIAWAYMRKKHQYEVIKS